ncbi:helix-turn-helix transcriptional regulator [Parabacteroides segnis]|uniref:helix-turn-helix domain-containing protein n=1 Tax=Parabacteroides segnis TaxID=2763058 RepID=UPI0035158FBA
MKQLKKKIQGDYELGEHITTLYAAYLDIDEDRVIYIFDEQSRPEEHYQFLARMDITHPYFMLGDTADCKSDFIIMFKKELLKEGLCKTNIAGTLFALSEKDAERIRIGRRITQLREESGMSQDELAVKIGTKQSAIARIEKGAFNVGFDTLQAIAEIFGLRIDFTK